MFENINFNPHAFIENLPIMGAGMAGIFAVIAIIIIAVYLLGFFGQKFSKNDNNND